MRPDRRPRPSGPPAGEDAAPDGVLAHVVLAEDAPGPTLVVRLDRLPPGALALSDELARLRRALARTPYAGLNKIALYGPSAVGAAELDYRFVQALPGGRFDFRAGCGHSLLACVVADGHAGREVTVRAVTTGDVVRCAPQKDGAYTLDFLRPPDAPGTLPTGRPVDVLDGVPVTLVQYGNPYVLVDARHLPADPARLPVDTGHPPFAGHLPAYTGHPPIAGHLRAHTGHLAADGRHPPVAGTAHVPVDALQAWLLELRAQAARLLGYAPESPLPKIALFTRTGPGGLAVRALTVGGWHPRLALTGAAAFAAAGAIGGTVVGGPVSRLRTPGAGTATVSTAPDRVRVHHKRARLLQRLDLPWPAPWRIHATA
ncbi:hypothetical protein ACFY8W_11935 [Streptomyces sp. NPDC012637]|uniref:hypothetical protein n=1 Tax=Streptomyces sp. NPDC012637 TaxID=3364842 RepID=UPI0036EC9131